MFAFSRRELNSNVRVNVCLLGKFGECKNAKVTHIYSTVNSEFWNYFCSVTSTTSPTSVSMEIENLPSTRNFRYNQNIVSIRFFTAPRVNTGRNSNISRETTLAGSLKNDKFLRSHKKYLLFYVYIKQIIVLR